MTEVNGKTFNMPLLMEIQTLTWNLLFDYNELKAHNFPSPRDSKGKVKILTLASDVCPFLIANTKP